MKEKTFQRNEKKMRHLSQLILFEKSYLYKRYSITIVLNVSAEVLWNFFLHMNKQVEVERSPRGVVDKRYAL